MNDTGWYEVFGLTKDDYAAIELGVSREQFNPNHLLRIKGHTFMKLDAMN